MSEFGRVGRTMAGIFRKIFGGFSHGHNKKDEREKQAPGQQQQKTPVGTAQQKPAGGFSVKVSVPTDPVVYAPVVTECNGNGGVQVSSSKLFACRWFLLREMWNSKLQHACMYVLTHGFVY